MNSNSQANYTTNESKSHTKRLHSIEKYEGTFAQDELGVTQIPTETIKAINDLTELAIFTFLASCSRDWKLNAKHLSSHFGCNKDKIYNALRSLIDKGFMTRTQLKEKGQFVGFHYQLHLRQVSKSPPRLEIPDVEKPDEENHDTYKTENIQNKDLIKKPIVDLSKSTGSYKEDILFMAFYSIYPNKQKPSVAHKAFYSAFKKSKEFATIEQFILKLVEDLTQRSSTVWKGRHKNKIPHPSSYLNNKEWEGEIYEPETGISKSTGSSKYSLADVLGA